MNLTKITEIFRALVNQNNAELLKNCELWATREKHIHVMIIAHLAEVEKRKIHLDEGYSSLFDYCLRKLKLSEGEAYSRIKVARVFHVCPEILSEIASGNLSLSVAAMLSEQLTINKEKSHNKEELIDVCRGKSKREVEMLLAEVNHKQQGKASHSVASFVPLGDQKFEVKFTIDENLLKKLLRLAELLGIPNPRSNISEVIDRAADIALNKKDPARKQPRSRRHKTESSVVTKNKIAPIKPSRYIASHTRSALFICARYQCEYTSESGQRCSQKSFLQIDHRFHFARGGTNDLENLQILCSAHNLRKCERDFGVQVSRCATINQ